MSKSGDVYPKVVSYISGNALWLEWEPISGAEGYVIGLKRGKSWTLLKQLPASCTEVSVPKVPSGTYELAVVAKLDGNWDTSNINSRTVTITIS